MYFSFSDACEQAPDSCQRDVRVYREASREKEDAVIDVDHLPGAPLWPSTTRQIRLMKPQKSIFGIFDMPC
jgi:hypothetical protein